MIELAVIGGEVPVKGERNAQAQEIQLKFLDNMLATCDTPVSCGASGVWKAVTGSRARLTRSPWPT